ncbi:alpha/beta hydrolase, partial [Modestobacter versicolor]
GIPVSLVSGVSTFSLPISSVEDAVALYVARLGSGVRGGQVVGVGESAGGWLALALAVLLRDRGLPQPAGTVVFSPWTDLTLSGASHHERAALDPVLSAAALAPRAAQYAGAAGVGEPLVSPLFADLRGLPPLLVQVGSAEVLLDDATGLAARAAAAGVPVTLEVEAGATHVFQLHHGTDPAADAALQRVGTFLRRVLERG